jgi:hypothetical protein
MFRIGPSSPSSNAICLSGRRSLLTFFNATWILVNPLFEMVFVFDLDQPDPGLSPFDQRKAKDALLLSTNRPTAVNDDGLEDRRNLTDTRLNLNAFSQALACYP